LGASGCRAGRMLADVGGLAVCALVVAGFGVGAGGLVL